MSSENGLITVVPNKDEKIYQCMQCEAYGSQDQFTQFSGYIRRCNNCVAESAVNKEAGEVRTTSSTGGQKGVKLERFDLIPIGPLTHLARHYGAGARKYDDHQWRNGYEYSKGYAALMRHLTSWWSGEDWDGCPPGDEGCSNVDKDGNEWAFGGLVERDGKAIPICYNHTGSHHLDGVMWHAFALREFVDKFPQHDDRYKKED